MPELHDPLHNIQTNKAFGEEKNQKYLKAIAFLNKRAIPVP